MVRREGREGGCREVRSLDGYWTLLLEHTVTFMTQLSCSLVMVTADWTFFLICQGGGFIAVYVVRIELTSARIFHQALANLAFFTPITLTLLELHWAD